MTLNYKVMAGKIATLCVENFMISIWFLRRGKYWSGLWPSRLLSRGWRTHLVREGQSHDPVAHTVPHRQSWKNRVKSKNNCIFAPQLHCSRLKIMPFFKGNTRWNSFSVFFVWFSLWFFKLVIFEKIATKHTIP